MRYALNSQEVSETQFAWTAPDGTELTITKDTIRNWIFEQGLGKEGAVSQIYSTLNNAFSNNLMSGESLVVIADDGTPVYFGEPDYYYPEG